MCWCAGISEAQTHLTFPVLNPVSVSKSPTERVATTLRSVMEESQGGTLRGKGLSLKNVSWPPRASLCLTDEKQHTDEGFLKAWCMGGVCPRACLPSALESASSPRTSKALLFELILLSFCAIMWHRGREGVASIFSCNCTHSDEQLEQTVLCPLTHRKKSWD